VAQLQLNKLRVESIEDLRRAIDGAHARSVPLGSGVPKGCIVHASIGEVLLTAGQFSADIRTRGDIESDRISLGVKLDSDSTHFSFRSGQEVLAGDVYALTRGDAVDHRVTGPIRYAFVSLSADRLHREVGDEGYRGDTAFWEQRRWFCASQPVRDSIVGSIQRLVPRVLRSESTLSAQALRWMQAELIEPFLWAFMFDEPNSNGRFAISGATIVKRVEDWVDGQSPETIHLADLCRALQVPRRTLQRAFTETLGMGPARYLTLKRLAAVRTALQRSDPAATTVTETAVQHGFWELGRFAKDYRQIFGERPSETLSRATR
jgi:AraC-like DNA-binding protein